MGFRRIQVVGSAFSMARFDEVVGAVLRRAKAGVPGYVCVSNVHTTMMGWFDSAYGKITNSSFLSVPDGMPLVWGMNLLGPRGHRQDRVRGPSLMREVCDRGRVVGLRHYLYGSTPSTLSALEATLRREFPGIELAGKESPPFRPLSSDELRATAKRINESGAEVLWVGLGAPKQERWMWDLRNDVVPVMLGVGAAFDLLPGVIPEAPAALQAMGMEWFYRLLKEPRRLWRRYLFNNPAYLVLLCGQVAMAKLFSRSYLCESPERE
ncbi:MAG: WecB/TagA/CpsF family glycosyltransferase [Bdellovibrionales bacterium]|nr:WecB/TagA/CpsF family glycosyltransferase [Bdellovibrionales bacterium]